MDAIDRKSIHHRGFSYVLGARSQFCEMPYDDSLLAGWIIELVILIIER